MTALRVARFAGLILGIAVLAGCGSWGQKYASWTGVSAGEKIAVLPLSDWLGGEDGKGSGLTCQTILVQELQKRFGANAETCQLSGYNPGKVISLDEAVAAAKARSATYALFGQCTVFYRVAPMTFRPDQGGMSIQVVKVQDKQVVYAVSRQVDRANFYQPEDCIRDLASVIADEIRPNQ